MISRREVVTAGVLGSLTGSAATAEASQGGSQDDAQTRAVMTRIQEELDQINTTLEAGLRGPSLSAGAIGRIRERLTTHLRSAGKFPDFMEIGTALFYDVYDWHVRHAQQIQITRISDQRFAIQFMFTQLIVRWEQDANYIGTPYRSWLIGASHPRPQACQAFVDLVGIPDERAERDPHAVGQRCAEAAARHHQHAGGLERARHELFGVGADVDHGVKPARGSEARALQVRIDRLQA